MAAIPYRIRRSDRARRARILVDGDGIEVVVPQRFPLREVEPFVEEKRAWIERTLERMRETEAELPPARLADGGEVPYLGERLGAGGARSSASACASTWPGAATSCRLALPPGTTVRDALERWYRRRARAEVGPRLDAACARWGSSYTRLQIRGQRTRWASCSSSGAMSFNWRLLLAPPRVLDYVVEHEVVHLNVLDHSQRFWILLSERVPDWREHERWLRRHGHALRL